LTKRNPTQKIGKPRPTDDRPRGQRTAPGHVLKLRRQAQTELDEAREQHDSILFKLLTDYAMLGLSATFVGLRIWEATTQAGDSFPIIWSAALMGYWVWEARKHRRQLREVVEGLTTLS
jgi:hypothetical protein